jgi:hypothetical protein
VCVTGVLQVCVLCDRYFKILIQVFCVTGVSQVYYKCVMCDRYFNILIQEMNVKVDTGVVYI